MRHAQRAQPREQLHGARQRPAARQQRPEDLAVAVLQEPRLLRGELVPHLARHGAGEEPPAHADPAVDPPPVDGHAGLFQGELPGEDVGVHGVDQRSVEVEDEGAHPGRV